MAKSKITTQLVAGFVVTLSALNTGFHFGWASPSLPQLMAEDSDLPITPDQSSWITSTYLLGGIFGAFIGVKLVDWCGRKRSILLTIIPLTCSCILIGAAHSYWWLIIARIIAGLGMGMTYTIVPMYLGEIADDRIRGVLGAMLSLMLNAGILLTYSVGPWLSRVALAGMGGALTLVFGLLFIWMPESPYFLILKDKPCRAEKSLSWLRGAESVNEELKKIQVTVEFDRKNSGTVKELVMIPGNRKALIIILGLMIAQQMSGITAILSYSSLIFEASGSTFDSNISVIIIGAIQFLSVMLTLFVVDLTGRRSLLLISTTGSTLFLGGEALYFQLQAIGTDVSAISWLPVTAIVGYMICYTIGLGGVPHIVLSEIFPCNVKALASMATSMFGCTSGLIVSKLYQVVADGYGVHVSFWGFAGITIFSTIFIYFYVPETKQRSFQSIQDELHNTTESKLELSKSEIA